MRITKAHVLVELPCDRCGGLCERLTVAEVLPDGRIGKPLMRPGREIVCNECIRKETESEEAKRYADQMQRAWANGNVLTKPGRKR
jgi:hypothetical protein